MYNILLFLTILGLMVLLVASICFDNFDGVANMFFYRGMTVFVFKTEHGVMQPEATVQLLSDCGCFAEKVQLSLIDPYMQLCINCAQVEESVFSGQKLEA